MTEPTLEDIVRMLDAIAPHVEGPLLQNAAHSWVRWFSLAIPSGAGIGSPATPYARPGLLPL
jgi:hypothetical protein